MMGFAIFLLVFLFIYFFNKKGVAAGGWWLVTKRRHIGRVGLGLWGRGGVDMRRLGAGGGGANT